MKQPKPNEKLEKFKKELDKKILRMLFPVLSTIPLPWIVIAIITFLFLFFGLLF